MFEESRYGIYFMLGGALLACFVARYVFDKVVGTRLAPGDDPVKKAILGAWKHNISASIFLVVLWFALPSTPSLATFGYPKDVARISRPEDLLEFLQWYNRAIVRTTEVVFWFIFVFFGWVLASQRQLLKAMGEAAAKAPRQ